MGGCVTVRDRPPPRRDARANIRPSPPGGEADLVGGAGRQVWEDNADTVASLIYGPHLAELARRWCRWHTGAGTLDGRVSLVAPATLPCREHRCRHELDVVAVQRRPFEPDVVLAVGEVKSAQTPVGEGELARLEHLRELLPAGRRPKLLLFARGGFTPGLAATAAGRGDVELVDLERMYHGD